MQCHVTASDARLETTRVPTCVAVLAACLAVSAGCSLSELGGRVHQARSLAALAFSPVENGNSEPSVGHFTVVTLPSLVTSARAQ